MTMNVETLTHLLLSGTTREAAARTLGWLKSTAGAASVSVWRTDGRTIALRLGIDLDQESMDRASLAWRESRKTLVDSGECEQDGARVLALEMDGAVHLAVVDGATLKVTSETIATCAKAVITALRHKAPLEAAALRPARNQLHRDELVAVLHREEWNIARVARVCGATRKTVYEWMAKLGIQREKVSKAGR